MTNMLSSFNLNLKNKLCNNSQYFISFNVNIKYQLGKSAQLVDV